MNAFLMTEKLWFGSFRREGLAQIPSSSSQHTLGFWAWQGRWVFTCQSRRKGWFRTTIMCDFHCENWQSKMVMHCQVKYNTWSSNSFRKQRTFPHSLHQSHLTLFCMSKSCVFLMSSSILASFIKLFLSLANLYPTTQLKTFTNIFPTLSSNPGDLT